MGIPKCFSHLGCLEVTLILRDFKTVTGRIVGNLGEDRKKFSDKCDDHEKHDDCDKCGDHKKHDDCDKCDDHKKHDEKCCNVDVKVDVDDKCDFILLELTRDAESVSLQEIEFEEEDDEEEIEITVANVEFKKGSCIAVNVCEIIYAGVNAEIEEEEIEIELCDCPDDLTATANQSAPVPTA